MLPAANKENASAMAANKEKLCTAMSQCAEKFAREAQQQQVQVTVSASAVEKRQPQLLGIEGPQIGESILLPLHVDGGAPTKEIVLGRSSECDVTILGDDTISRKHLKIKAFDGNLWLTDLDTTYGTQLRRVIAEFWLERGVQEQQPNISSHPVHGWTKVEHGDILTLGQSSVWLLLLKPSPKKVEVAPPRGPPTALPPVPIKQGSCASLAPPSAPLAPMKKGSFREKQEAEAKAAAVKQEAEAKAAAVKEAVAAKAQREKEVAAVRAENQRRLVALKEKERELQEAMKLSLISKAQEEAARAEAQRLVVEEVAKTKAAAAEDAIAAVAAKAEAEAKAAAEAQKAEAAANEAAAACAAPDISDAEAASAASVGLRDGQSIEVLWKIEEDDGSLNDVWWRASLRLPGGSVSHPLDLEAAAASADVGVAILDYAAMHGFEAETLRVNFLDASAAFHLGAHDGWLRHAPPHGSKMPWRHAHPAAVASSHAPPAVASSQLPPALPGICRAVKQNGGLCCNKIHSDAPHSAMTGSAWREHTCGVHKHYKGELRPPPPPSEEPPLPLPPPPPPPGPSTEAAMAQLAAEAKARLAEERARKKSLENHRKSVEMREF